MNFRSSVYELFVASALVSNGFSRRETFQPKPNCFIGRASLGMWCFSHKHFKVLLLSKKKKHIGRSIYIYEYITIYAEHYQNHSHIYIDPYMNCLFIAWNLSLPCSLWNAKRSWLIWINTSSASWRKIWALFLRLWSKHHTQWLVPQKHLWTGYWTVIA